MRNILIIAGREVRRLRARFGGRMLAAVAVLLAAAAAAYLFASQQGMVLAKDFYVVGVSTDAPALNDGRFHVIVLDPVGPPQAMHVTSSGRPYPELDLSPAGQALKSGSIDAYVSGQTIYYRGDNRSQYAANAVKTYLKTGELQRVAASYPLNQAFPLRVEVNYLKAPSRAIGSATVMTLADIMGSASRASAADIGPAMPPGGAAVAGARQAAGQPVTVESDFSVMQQLDGLGRQRSLPEFKAEFASDREVIVPSLMTPPIPLAQVLLAFAYILPLFFVSIFFTSGFIEEKMGRKLNVLLSTPVTPLQIIIGKMLPYICYSLFIVLAITAVLRGNLLLAAAIFLPVILFIFAIYLGVALQYRTFKDQTFFSLLAVTGITGYLVFPAMFTGINDLSYVSPLTLAVQMYRGVEITAAQYMLSAVPMLLVFALALAVGTRVFNEEYLLSFRPIHVKVRDAIYFTLDKRHLMPSIGLLSLMLIPVVFLLELGTITLAINLPRVLAICLAILVCVLVEETAKSLPVAVAVERGLIKRWQQVVLAGLLSALSFFIGEKLLLFMSLKVISESIFTAAVFASNALWMPLAVHCACTLIVCLTTHRLGMKGYPVALLAGSLLHGAYNLMLVGAFK